MRCAARAIGERVGALALILTASACGVLAPLEGTPPCADYASVVQPALAESCVGCHGSTSASGDYRLDSRAAALARRPDGSSRIAAADGGVSAFVAALTGTLPGGHPAVTFADGGVATLTTWATVCHGASGRQFFHPPGWGTDGDPEFHAVALRASGYQLEPCQACHGTDLAGGKSGVSCQTCHGANVLACQTCHGSAANAAPPASLSRATATTTLGVGAHQAHVNDGPLHKAYGCDACHVPVTDVRQASHFPQDGGAPDAIAEVVFGSDAGTWTRATATCAGTTCHAPSVDTLAANQAPVWTADGGQATCGTCHGLPPSTHLVGDTACARCHPMALVGGGPLVASHADGVVQLGRTLPDGGAPGSGPSSCGSCHASAAPFHDTQGNTAVVVPTVGLHDVHLIGRLRLTAAIQCIDCHQVPATVRSPGHLDTPAPAEVFPAVAGVGVRARFDGAQPAYSAATATCTNVYCHGAGVQATGDGGINNPGDSSRSRVKFWPWNYGIGIDCDSCHGAPPNTPPHATTPVGDLTKCSRCHPASIDATGKLIVSVDGGVVSTTHLDGTIEVVP
jgi:predicted CxxxxCH...CXXCH cytochrome family protein